MTREINQFSNQSNRKLEKKLEIKEAFGLQIEKCELVFKKQNINWFSKSKIWKNWFLITKNSIIGF